MFSQKKNNDTKQAVVTANELINIADIQGNFLYTKNNMIFAYLKISPIPVALMTRTEKETYTNQLKRELSPMELPFKIFLISRSTDVRRNIEYLEQVKANETMQIKRDLLTADIKFLANMSSSAGVQERLAYLCVWIQRSPSRDETYLLDKISDFSKALSACKVTNHLLSEQEMIQLAHMTLNPHDTSNIFVNDAMPTSLWNSTEVLK